jgi:RimJ/RimL family protein N-acetyltransferase
MHLSEEARMVGSPLFGAKVNLRPVRNDDLNRRVDWLNDPETVQLFTGIVPNRLYDVTDAERWRTAMEKDARSFLWAIETKSGRHIGDVDLHGIDRVRGVSKLTILIGDKLFWNKGYGSDAVSLVLDHAFSDLDMDSVSLKVFNFNKRGLRCYEKCGFSPIPPTLTDALINYNPGETAMTVTRSAFMSRLAKAA